MEFKYPDWNNPVDILISRSNGGKRIARSEYTQSPKDILSLRVTVEIAGGAVLFERFESEEAKNAAYLEENRRAAWRNAIRFAEQLWKTEPSREYVVSFRTENANVGCEAVCIYRRIV